MWMRSTCLALFPHHVLASAFKVLCVVDDAQPRILTFLIPSLSLSLSLSNLAGLGAQAGHFLFKDMDYVAFVCKS